MSFHKKGGFGGEHGKKPAQLYSATCANCHKPCEVPFRPQADRPVYCKECFNKSRGNAGNRDHSRNAESRRPVPAPSSHTRMAQNNDKDTYSLRKHLDSIHNKLDVIVKMIEDLPSQKKTTTKSKTEKAVKKVKKTGKK